jgi:hypothetical protein
MTACPLCRLPLKAVGRLISANDDARQNFVFPICNHCTARLGRLPAKLQRRQMMIAMRNLSDDPDKYGVRLFDDAVSASIFCYLEAARLSGQVH